MALLLMQKVLGHFNEILVNEIADRTVKFTKRASFCRPCLKGTIQNAETAVVKCPYTDQDYSCDMQLLDREIKSVGVQLNITQTSQTD